MVQSQTLVSGGGAGARVAASSAAVELGRRLLLAARAGDTPLVLDLMAKGAPFTTDWVRAIPLLSTFSTRRLIMCVRNGRLFRPKP